MKKTAQKMKVAKRGSCRKCKPAVEAASSYEPSALWRSAAFVIMAPIFCGGALSAISFLSFVPAYYSDRFLTQVYQAYALPGLAVNRLASGEKIADENIFGLLQIKGNVQVGQVAGAVEKK